jgi:TPR repeat protein
VAEDDEPEKVRVNRMMALEDGNLFAVATLGAYYCEGQVVRRNWPAGVALLEVAVAEGDAQAKGYLGALLMKGTPAIPANPERGFGLLTQAAMGNDVFGLEVLGRLYANGGHVPVNRERALDLFDRARDRSSTALYELGQIYEHGKGGPADLDRAAYEYRRAITAGHHSSAVALLGLLQSGRDSGRAFPETTKWLADGVVEGDVDRAGMLGRFVMGAEILPGTKAHTSLLWWGPKEPLRRLHPELALTLNGAAYEQYLVLSTNTHLFRMAGDMAKLWFIWNHDGRMPQPWNVLATKDTLGVTVNRTRTDGVVTATEVSFKNSATADLGFFIYVAEDAAGRLSNLVFIETVE